MEEPENIFKLQKLQQLNKLPKKPAQPHFSSCLYLEFWRGFSYPGWGSNLEQHNYSKCCSNATYEKMPRNKEIDILLQTAGG